MTDLRAAPAASAIAPGDTSTIGATLRRRVLWIVLAVVLLVVTVGAALLSLTGGGSQGAFDIENSGTTGSMAVANVLRDHGVEVQQTRSLGDTSSAVSDPADTTIVVWDGQQLLDESRRNRLLTLATRLVVVEPDSLSLVQLAPGVLARGALSPGSHAADCALPAVLKADSVVATGSVYSVSAAADATVCIKDGAPGALVRLTVDGTQVTVLGASSVLQNGTISQEGDAALALNLLGETHRLIWYLPSAADVPATDGGGPSLAALTPEWVTPAIALLILGFVAAAVWRGRRFGPLVIEPLPVVVRSSETMEGRARLYERSSDRLHALDALRVATVSRLAISCGLPRRATLPEVVDAVAAITGRDRAAVSAILLDAVPRTDGELMRWSDELLRLEHDTDAAARGR